MSVWVTAGRQVGYVVLQRGGVGWSWVESDRKVVSLRRGGPVEVNVFFYI